eukprot:TRINITY_DN34_c0_g1_i1.p1 TRINITY_DN34_c0_g1~~TRINITY_DN34_c0_g1_i1.p1  ORF type:complete len:185 (+),score=18.68 TRINITY_DN34_c0_g1_i1:250-804(+)
MCEEWELESITPSNCAWPCEACTFLNHSDLSHCEVCGAQLQSAKANKAEVCRNSSIAQSDDWPSLHEAITSFVDCEISSEGSWLDVGAGFEEEHDLDAVLVAPGKVSAPTSWLSLAKKAAMQSVPAKLPAAGVKVPPLLPSVVKSKGSTSWQPYDEDFGLECLVTSRVRLQSKRGSTRRLCAKG